MPMSLSGTVFPIVMWLILLAWFIFFSILVMHFLMPKFVLEKYFKPPFFKEAECNLFTGIPYAPLRTIMLMTVFAFPSRGKKRKLTDAHLSVATWYKVASKIIIISLVVTIVAIILLLFGAYFIDEFITK